MPTVSALNGMKFVSPNTSFGIIRRVAPIVSEVAKDATISPAVIVSISQAAQEAAGLTIKGAASPTLLTPFNSRDITPELLSSVQKTLLDTYNRQTALASSNSSTIDYSTRMSLQSVSKTQDSIRRYLVSPPPSSNVVENRVASIVHAAAKSYVSLRDAGVDYANSKNYVHVDIGTRSTRDEELLKTVMERSASLLKQQFNLATRGLSAYDSRTLTAFSKYASSPEMIQQALEKPSLDVASLDFQFAVFIRQVAKDVVSDIASRRGEKRISIDKSQFESIEKDTFLEILKKMLAEDIDSFKKSIVKSLPSAEAMKDTEMGYEFSRKVIDSGMESIVETTQKVVDDPLVDEYSGFVTLNRLVSKALVQYKQQMQDSVGDKSAELSTVDDSKTNQVTRVLGIPAPMTSSQLSRLKIFAAAIRPTIVRTKV